MVTPLSARFSLFLLFAIFASGKSVEVKEEYLRFPPNFLLGAATAAYQIEGAWNVSGRGESSWDRFCHTPGHVYNNDTGDVATDSYHKYKEDIALLKTLGMQLYRFSVSWTRILPTGFPNKISEDGVQYYHNVIDEVLAQNITPLMTIYHWDHPQVFEDAGGWTNSEMVDWFGDFARVVFREYGDKVKLFIPINEPLSICKDGYTHGNHAPGKKLHGFGEYLCIHHTIMAHARAYRIYESEFKESQNGQVGFMVNLAAYIPRNDADVNATEIAYQFNVGWTMHPVYSAEGDYPPVMKEMIAKKSMEQGFMRSRLPSFDEDWINYIRGSSDFLAVNHYTSRLVTNGTMGLIPSHENDEGVLELSDPFWKQSASKWLQVVPEGMRLVLKYLAKNYGNPTMYITENGVSDLGTLNDDDRIYYYREYLKQMLLAIYEDGVNVKGYTLWSLLDNFEWDKGYRERFGIVYVDFNDPNRTRILKKSASWWQKVIAERRLDQS